MKASTSQRIRRSGEIPRCLFRRLMKLDVISASALTNVDQMVRGAVSCLAWPGQDKSRVAVFILKVARAAGMTSPVRKTRREDQEGGWVAAIALPMSWPSSVRSVCSAPRPDANAKTGAVTFDVAVKELRRACRPTKIDKAGVLRPSARFPSARKIANGLKALVRP